MILKDELEKRDGTTRVFQKKSVIYYKDEKASNLYLVVKGSVKLIREDDRRDFIIDIYNEGDTFGEFEILDGFPRAATAVCRTESIIKTVEWDGSCLDLLMVQVLKQYRKSIDVMENLGLNTSYTKLVKFLNYRCNENSIIPERFTHQDLADSTGTCREMITTIMKQLIEGEYISIIKKTITILKPLPKKW